VWGKKNRIGVCKQKKKGAELEPKFEYKSKREEGTSKRAGDSCGQKPCFFLRRHCVKGEGNIGLGGLIGKGGRGIYRKEERWGGTGQEEDVRTEKTRQKEVIMIIRAEVVASRGVESEYRKKDFPARLAREQGAQKGCVTMVRGVELRKKEERKKEKQGLLRGKQSGSNPGH